MQIKQKKCASYKQLAGRIHTSELQELNIPECVSY